MDYPKSVPSVGLVDGKFVDENPLNGTPGSLIPANWGNSVTSEILAVIKSSGLVPDEGNNAQMAAAIGLLTDFANIKNKPSTLSGYGIADAGGRLLSVKQFGTVGVTLYIPGPRVRRILVRLVGAGGSGGGTDLVTAGSYSLGGGGGSGARAESLYDISAEMLAGIPITLGMGGVAKTGRGAVGGSASFGTYMSVSGGYQGESVLVSSTGPGFVQGGTGGGVSTGGNLVNARGVLGGFAMTNPGWGTLSGTGGASYFDGGGGGAGLNGNGLPGVRGSGGGGSCSSSTTVRYLGGAGGDAFCEVWEYE